MSSVVFRIEKSRLAAQRARILLNIASNVPGGTGSSTGPGMMPGAGCANFYPTLKWTERFESASLRSITSVIPQRTFRTVVLTQAHSAMLAHNGEINTLRQHQLDEKPR